ncbi:FaeA/PapI family transcriptional regulator, partial [Salmonella enterica]|nr:FaeA/PapI family transcriptional regulator [Salmonella enterica]
GLSIYQVRLYLEQLPDVGGLEKVNAGTGVPGLRRLL